MPRGHPITGYALHTRTGNSPLSLSARCSVLPSLKSSSAAIGLRWSAVWGKDFISSCWRYFRVWGGQTGSLLASSCGLHSPVPPRHKPFRASRLGVLFPGTCRNEWKTDNFKECPNHQPCTLPLDGGNDAQRVGFSSTQGCGRKMDTTFVAPVRCEAQQGSTGPGIMRVFLWVKSSVRFTR